YDINGDGYSDVVISDRGYDVGTGAADLEHGISYLQLGSSGGLSSSLSTITFQLWNAENHYSGQGSGMLADIDADNDDELLIGAYQYDGSANQCGSVALFRGATSLSGAKTEANAAILITGGYSSNLYLGWAATGLGDVYGSDGKPDWAFSALGNNASAVYVVSGALANGSYNTTTGAVSSVPQASNGDSVGSALVGDYDNDGDGLADLAFAAAGASAVYIYQGPLSAGALPLANADITMAITTMSAFSTGNYYSNVANAGDTNGDGYDDLVVGGDAASSNGGKAYLYLGPVGATTSPTVTLTGATNDGLGKSVSGGIDVDRDGRDDWLVGAQGADSGGTNNGAVALIYGGASGSYTLTTLAATTSGAVWFGGNGALLGARVLGAGD
ncbi:MAG TPA: FG-GAP-like repeat-containing protein, partial [Myxococcota bacterium]|nr:FG-GAP-like repeat-containing protein [Myxococcota bacterium]